MEEERLIPATRETPRQNEVFRVLVISETYPRAEDIPLHNLLLALLSLGHEITYIAREGLNRQGDGSALRRLGIPAYADDPDRVVMLGKQIPSAPTWNFAQVLTVKNYEIAILTEDFDLGLTAPEQYLDLIRQESPETRVIVWTRDVFYAMPRPSTSNRHALEEFEKNQDRVFRQREVLERADSVLISDQSGLALLGHKESRALGPCRPESISKALRQVRSIVPRTAAAHPFSVMQVEKRFSGRLSSRTGLQRLQGHLECYAMLAGLLMSEGNFSAARDQLRHIFGRMDGSWDAAEFVTQIIILLRRCYRELGESDLTELYCQAARECAMSNVAGTPMPPPKRHNANAPLISLIVPTYNRLPILRKCLAALEAQTLPKSEFEVLVIDDGSSDGTEEFLRQYTSSLGFQRLRQRNSGTGAARRHGVSHARGDYLLLMNDDTICDPDLLEQHLKVQRKLGAQRWAVLGSFQYPTEARCRALTHYFCVDPFMFPQVSMEDGCPYGYSHFITCNLSVRRDAVEEVGSFSSVYKLSEDTELGLRLYDKGFRVLYHPAAHAWHDHLPYPAQNLIRRARVYGKDYFHMFRQHPRVMKEWAMPVALTGMDERNATRILAYLDTNRKDVEEAVRALEKWDQVDFGVLLTEKHETADMVLSLFRQAVPAVHWFYLYEAMLQTMVSELGLANAAPEQLAGMARSAAAGS